MSNRGSTPVNFSKRMGLEPATKPFQNDSMDGYLRNGLWNALDLHILPYFTREWVMGTDGLYSRTFPNSLLFEALWKDFYRWQLPTLPQWAQDALKTVHTWFFDERSTPWNRVYDFTEFVANTMGLLPALSKEFKQECDFVMEREFSAYRFIGTTIGPITSEAEIKAIEQAALMDYSLLRPVGIQIDKALKLLSDREKPDYRNSIKESISAVETLCRVIAGDKATLGQALKPVKDKVCLHPALEKAFSSLYGWTNDAGGIRHALMDDSIPCDFEDAKYMLVSCSAFVNYLVEKANKNGLLPK
jgi:AbiJ N-terminal domain 4